MTSLPLQAVKEPASWDFAELVWSRVPAAHCSPFEIASWRYTWQSQRRTVHIGRRGVEHAGRRDRWNAASYGNACRSGSTPGSLAGTSGKSWGFEYPLGRTARRL